MVAWTKLLTRSSQDRNTVIECAGLAEQPIPSVTTGVYDLARGLKGAVREAIDLQ
jgi:hypothetical protein